MTHGSVASVTALVKTERLNRVVDRMRSELSGQARAMIERYLRNRQTTSFVLHQEAIATQNRRLSQTIADTAQLVELGSVLARSAKIEAAYGGSFSAALMQVSSDFEHTIAEIHRSLEQLSRHHD